MQPFPPQNPETRDPIAQVFHLYDPPLWLVTARDGHMRGGLVATCAVRVSIVAELPRMAIGLAKHHRTWGLVQSSGRFALHLLGEEDLDAVWRFGLRTGHETDKLAGLHDDRTPDGNPLYREAVAWLDCRVETSLDVGDRTLFLAEIVGGGVLGRRPVLGVARLLAAAPPERRAELDRLYARDRTIDTQAILEWRGARGHGPAG